MSGENNKKALFFVPMRLQFFADEGGEKTEQATPKKLSDARKEGQVAQSKELSTAVMLMSLFAILKIMIGYIGSRFLKCFRDVYQIIDVYASEDFSTSTASAFLRNGLVDVLLICLPVFAVAVTAAFAVSVVQVKWQVTSKPLKPKFDKFNPMKGIKRIFSKDKIFELIKDIVKIVLIFYIAYSDLRKAAGAVVILYDLGLEQAVVYIGNFVINLGVKISAVYLAVGLVDYIYQKMKFKKDLMMSKEEVKNEYKQQEGDPQIKGRIKAKMREVSQRRMMQKLPEADVVITNPTHFACALKYDKEVSSAPVLIAKGADYVAQKIKDAAKEHNIPIVENKPLARMLYYNVDLDSEIPRELYQMTAEVLSYVYKLKHGGAA